MNEERHPHCGSARGRSVYSMRALPKGKGGAYARGETREGSEEQSLHLHSGRGVRLAAKVFSEASQVFVLLGFRYPGFADMVKMIHINSGSYARPVDGRISPHGKGREA